MHNTNRSVTAPPSTSRRRGCDFVRENCMNRQAAGFAAAMLATLALGATTAEAETIAVFTKSQNSPIFTALRAGALAAAKNLGVQVVHYVPSTADNVAEQIKLIDDAIKDKPD